MGHNLFPCTSSNHSTPGIRCLATHRVTRMARLPLNMSQVRPEGHMFSFKAGHLVLTVTTVPLATATIGTLAIALGITVTVGIEPTVTLNTTIVIDATELHHFRTYWFRHPRKRCEIYISVTVQCIFRFRSYCRKAISIVGPVRSVLPTAACPVNSPWSNQ